MKKTILFIFLSFVAINTQAQKVKIKNDIATVDGEEYLHWDKRSGTEISVRGLNAEEEEVYIMYLNYTDPSRVSNSNPEGKVRWVEIHFLTLEKKCEIQSRTQKGVVKTLFENEIYVDGALNEENADKLVKKYGMRFSDNRPQNSININIKNE